MLRYKSSNFQIIYATVIKTQKIFFQVSAAIAMEMHFKFSITDSNMKNSLYSRHNCTINLYILELLFISNELQFKLLLTRHQFSTIVRVDQFISYLLFELICKVHVFEKMDEFFNEHIFCVFYYLFYPGFNRKPTIIQKIIRIYSSIFDSD